MLLYLELCNSGLVLLFHIIALLSNDSEMASSCHCGVHSVNK